MKRIITLPEEKDLQKDHTRESVRAKMERGIKSLESRGVEARIRTVLAGARYDLIDVHLYDVPESWAGYIAVFREKTVRQPDR